MKRIRTMTALSKTLLIAVWLTVAQLVCAQENVESSFERSDGTAFVFTGVSSANSDGITLFVEDGLEFVPWQDIPETEVKRVFSDSADYYRQWQETRKKIKLLPAKSLPEAIRVNGEPVPQVWLFAGLGIAVLLLLLFVIFVVTRILKLFSRKVNTETSFSIPEGFGQTSVPEKGVLDVTGLF